MQGQNSWMAELPHQGGFKHQGTLHEASQHTDNQVVQHSTAQQ
jgi:hypothetical protein